MFVDTFASPWTLCFSSKINSSKNEQWPTSCANDIMATIFHIATERKLFHVIGPRAPSKCLLI